MKKFFLPFLLLVFISGCQNEIPTSVDNNPSKLSKNSNEITDASVGGMWTAFWTNNGSGYLGTWNISPNDKFYINEHRADLFIVNDIWAATISYNNLYNEFIVVWSNGGTGQIGNWLLNSLDKRDFIKLSNSRSNLLNINSSGFAAMYELLESPRLTWNNAGNNKIGTWLLSANDIFLIGDWASNFMGEELLIINSPWCAMYRYDTYYYEWYEIWNNGGNGIIGNWVVNSNQKFIVADYDNDNLAELLCTENNGTNSQLLNFTGSSWEMVWGSSNNYIGNWYKNSQDYFSAGRFDNGTKGKLLSVNSSSQWASFQQFIGSSWSPIWNNLGSGFIGTWQINQNDKYFEYVKMGGQKYLFCINQTWAALLKYGLPE